MVSLFVKPIDIHNEITVLKYVMANGRLFKGLKFVRNTDPASTFDFSGFDRNDDLVAKVDIKVRDIRSDQYPDFFISKEKYIEAQQAGKIVYYMIYAFTKDHKILVFNLTFCDFKRVERQTIQHKRAGRPITSLVYLISRKDCVEEFQYDLG